MNEVYINIKDIPEWLIKKYFNKKEFYSIDELISIIDDLDSDLGRIQEQFEDYKEYVKDNYKFIDYM